MYELIKRAKRACTMSGKHPSRIVMNTLCMRILVNENPDGYFYPGPDGQLMICGLVVQDQDELPHGAIFIID